MANYTGPVCKLCRREQAKLFLKGDKCHTHCVLDKRPTKPGMAGVQRGKPSAYAVRLREKQKLRRFVLMNEKPFRRWVEEAAKSPNSGTGLLSLLEMRLDNIVRLMGIASSLKTARKIVLHGHVKVNGRLLNISSYRCQAGDIIAVSPSLKENVGVKLSLETAQRLNNRPNFMEFDPNVLSAKITRLPEKSELSLPVSEQLIVEYYSR
jgi:small subunit ribosomal protein S4